MAGFESSDQLNVHGDRVDFLQLTSHLKLLDDDYRMLGPFEISSVREGVRWSQVEKSPNEFDFSTVKTMLDAGDRAGVQQIWDLCHFGYPDDLTPLHPHFCRRFVAFCAAFAEFHKASGTSQVLIVTPINEVSFISWLGGDAAGTSPFCNQNGWQVKYCLVRAYIAGIQALRQVNPGVRILTTEPLISITAEQSATQELIEQAAHHHELQFQVLDMLCGRMCPELGGHPEYLDLLGFNYYYDNQWIHNPYGVLGWRDAVPHPNLKPLSELLENAHHRYDRPIVLSETSHPGIDRPLWIQYISDQVCTLLQRRIPLWGICIYPIIDRPDWDRPDCWHHAGLWDYFPDDNYRVLHKPSADALFDCQRMLGAVLSASENQKSFYISNLNGYNLCMR